jgi:copper(I)-binding protein
VQVMRSESAVGRRWLFIAVLALSSITSLSSPSIDVQIGNAWIRWLPANLPGAGYMTVTNTGAAAVALIGAGSSDYGEVSFHETRNEGGMNEMAPIASIPLKPHSSVRFESGGYHLMLMQPKRPLHPGDKVMVTFRLSDGRTITVPFLVRAGNEIGAGPLPQK